MNATVKKETLVVLTLTEREAALLRALFNGLRVNDDGARALASEIASSLKSGERLSLDQVEELNELCSEVYETVSEAVRS